MMIIAIDGTNEFIGEKFVVIKTSEGIGYKLFVSEETLRKIPEIGKKVKLWTHQYVRENEISLYGFYSYAELDFFEKLIGISGIGPKGALAVLGVAPVDTLKKAIAAQDTSYLTRVSGIGRKIADKIVLELKDKMAGKGVVLEAPELKNEADALDVLIALGFSQKDARDALLLVSPQVTSVEEKVREALKMSGMKK